MINKKIILIHFIRFLVTINIMYTYRVLFWFINISNVIMVWSLLYITVIIIYQKNYLAFKQAFKLLRLFLFNLFTLYNQKTDYILIVLVDKVITYLHTHNKYVFNNNIINSSVSDAIIEHLLLIDRLILIECTILSEANNGCKRTIIFK